MAVTRQELGVGSLIIFGRLQTEEPSIMIRALIEQSEEVLIFDPEADEVSLQRAWPTLSTVKVVPAAVADVDGVSPLITYSIPGLRSITKPTRHLRSIYPNLRVSYTRTVTTLSASTVVNQLTDFKRPLYIIIDDHSFNASIIDAMAQLCLLQIGNLLCIRSSNLPLFESSEDRQSLHEKLSRIGMELGSVEEDDIGRSLILYGVAADGQPWDDCRSDALKGDTINTHGKVAKIADLELQQFSNFELQNRHVAKEADLRLAELEQRLVDKELLFQAVSAELGAVQRREGELLHALQSSNAQRVDAEEQLVVKEALLQTLQADSDAQQAREAELQHVLNITEAKCTELAQHQGHYEAEKHRMISSIEELQAKEAELNKAFQASATRNSELEHRVRLSKEQLQNFGGQLGLITDLLLTEVKG